MAEEKEFLYAKLEDTGIDKTIIDAIMRVPRENFVRKEYLSEAYGDYPLPTMAGQTISQPTTVALMLEYLELKGGMKVLEIGCGSGWNAAIMGQLVGPRGKVFSLEILSELIHMAKANLKTTQLKNVKIIRADGSIGYPEEAPFDRIIVTAATHCVNKEWVDQLVEGGIIVAPVGHYIGQKMAKVVKEKGAIREKDMGYFQFVPLRTEKELENS
ncbi:protein-L-isoaspartate(D-aspartate) O-methyltransferase [Candidatus Woesearchaeota archaeon]|nr:protein-L-isoaspartate(D-aspartate) O-methyltransferase [Candidatus Woesearchaeota archaeon]